MSQIVGIWIGPFVGEIPRSQGLDPEIAEPGETPVHIDSSEGTVSQWWAYIVANDGSGLVNVAPWDLGIDSNGDPFWDTGAGPAPSEDVDVYASGGSGLVDVQVELAP